RLAPVTYLPGASPSRPAASSPLSAASSSPSAADDTAERARAERVSMHALARRGVSVAELRVTLLARELPEHIVEHELERLERVGLLDDEALAETLVRTLRERKKLGRTALAAELSRRRIDSTAIAA